MARDKKAPSSKAKAVKPVGAREKRGHDRDKQKYNQRTGDAREVALEGRVLRLKKLIERKAGSGSVESSLTRVQLAEGLCAHANQTPPARMPDCLPLAVSTGSSWGATPRRRVSSPSASRSIPRTVSTRAICRRHCCCGWASTPRRRRCSARGLPTRPL